MDKKRFSVFKLALFSLLVLGLAASAFGQGRRPGGAPAGPPAGRGPGSGNVGGPPSGVGVDRGIGTASTRSEGRSNRGLGTASENSAGRSDSSLDRARLASSRLEDADEVLRNHPGLPHAMNMGANQLRSGFQAALVNNPNLKFGHYVAATRLEQNLGPLHPAITRDALLAGLASGRSIGRTLQDLGLSDDEAFEARKRAEREIKEAKKNK